MATDFQLSGKRVWVAGHNGMVGAALLRRLAREDCQILSAPRSELDLTRQADTEAWIAEHRPEAVFVAASRVGGILANDTYPADFLYENLMIEANIMRACARLGVAKLLFLGSSCIYPRLAAQPMAEEALLTGPLEPTNEAYAIAKIAGVRLAQSLRRQYGVDFICAMPTNLYGPGDNYELASAHVLAALLRKAHEAKLAGGDSLIVWGSGRPRREFLHVDDCADALVHMMKRYSEPLHLNVGAGEDIAIIDLARLIGEVVGFTGELAFDPGKPDGAPRKLLDVGRLTAIGWRHSIGLREGVSATYQWLSSQPRGLRW
ncbi:MAG TPA: GDP-L-fucose synthase [Caulobacteraceae bacterium]|nr:GDP-L-fucose synthase [Caulobacteraceae bacterium]